MCSNEMSISIDQILNSWSRMSMPHIFWCWDIWDANDSSKDKHALQQTSAYHVPDTWFLI